MISGPPGEGRGRVEEVAQQAGLTPRETEVLLLNVGEGLNYHEIGDRLSITPRTVQSLISKARTKILAEFDRQSQLDDTRDDLASAIQARQAA